MTWLIIVKHEFKIQMLLYCLILEKLTYFYLDCSSFLIFFARLGYYWKQRNGIQESQVSKLCRYCQNPLCFQWLSQWCWPGVAGIFTASYYHFIIIMSQFITFILLSVDIVLLSYLCIFWLKILTGWLECWKKAKWMEAAATGKVWCLFTWTKFLVKKRNQHGKKHGKIKLTSPSPQSPN